MSFDDLLVNLDFKAEESDRGHLLPDIFYHVFSIK